MTGATPIAPGRLADLMTDNLQARMNEALQNVLAKNPGYTGMVLMWPRPSITMWNTNDPTECETFYCEDILN